MFRNFVEFFKYILKNLIEGNFNLGILVLTTISLFAYLLNEILVFPAILTLVLGTGICIIYSNFEDDKKNKTKKEDI